MRIRKTILAVLGATLLCGNVWAGSFTAALDRDTLTLGETATLALTFEGGGQTRTVPTPHVPGLQIVQSGTSQSMSIVNGAMSSTQTVNFSVTAQREGEFTIPPLTAEVNGKTISSGPLKLTVIKATAPAADAVNSGNELGFMRLNFSPVKLYLGQTAVARLEIYLRDDVQNYGNFQLTSAVTEGFNTGKIAEIANQRRSAKVGNRNYTVISLAIPLTAVRTGTLNLGPFTASLVVALAARGGDPFFRQFFNQTEQKQITLASEAVTLDALPLPKQNQPANFNGAVGQFTMTATAGPTNVTVGDPITVRVQISGQGALDSVTLPPQEAWRNFKTYPPTSKVEITDPYGFQGTKTFEQIISPQSADVRELPALIFSFFNPDDGLYHTLTQPAVPLTIKSAGATPLPTVVANKNATTENQTTQDLLPLRENFGTLIVPSAPLIAQPAFLALQSVPVLAFLAAFVWRRRAESLAKNPRLRRQQAVAQQLQSGLIDLRKFAAANQADEFFALLFRLLQEQLGERLDCPATAITENVIEVHPAFRTAAPGLVEELHELFHLCNQARYAPVRGSGELNSVVEKFEKTSGKLQGVKA